MKVIYFTKFIDLLIVFGTKVIKIQ